VRVFTIRGLSPVYVKNEKAKQHLHGFHIGIGCGREKQAGSVLWAADWDVRVVHIEEEGDFSLLQRPRVVRRLSIFLYF
jgi:hypothetical protein